MKNDSVEGSESPTDRLLNVTFKGIKEKQECRATASPTTSCDTTFKKLLHEGHDFALSSRNTKDIPMMHYLLGRAASGLSSNEDDVFDAFPNNRYRRKDCLRLLRRFHRSFPNHTELKVICKLWTLTPVPFKGYVDYDRR